MAPRARTAVDETSSEEKRRRAFDDAFPQWRTLVRLAARGRVYDIDARPEGNLYRRGLPHARGEEGNWASAYFTGRRNAPDLNLGAEGIAEERELGRWLIVRAKPMLVVRAGHEEMVRLFGALSYVDTLKTSLLPSLKRYARDATADEPGLLEFAAFTALSAEIGDESVAMKPVTVTVDYMRPGLERETFAACATSSGSGRYGSSRPSRRRLRPRRHRHRLHACSSHRRRASRRRPHPRLGRSSRRP